MGDLSVDDALGAHEFRRPGFRPLQQCDRVAHGGERVSEFVREHGEKSILMPVLLLQKFTPSLLLALCLTAFFDAAENEHYADDGPVGSSDRCSAVVNGHLAAVTSDENGVVGEPGDFVLSQDPPDGAFHRGMSLLVDDAKD